MVDSFEFQQLSVLPFQLETELAEAKNQWVTSEGDKFCKEEGEKLR